MYTVPDWSTLSFACCTSLGVFRTNNFDVNATGCDNNVRRCIAVSFITSVCLTLFLSKVRQSKPTDIVYYNNNANDTCIPYDLPISLYDNTNKCKSNEYNILKARANYPNDVARTLACYSLSIYFILSVEYSIEV